MMPTNNAGEQPSGGTQAAASPALSTKSTTKTPLRIIMLGPPGCGKGTQSAHIKDRFALAHLATGDMLRAAVARGTPIGKRAKSFMDAGQLVPDEVVLEVVAEAIKEEQCRNGFIFDGFPRTLNQAEKLDQIMERERVQLHAVLDLEIDDALLIRRITGRLIHPPSGRSYHEEFNPPKVPMTDDITGEPLVKRSDDNEESLRRRLEAYHEQTAPLTEYYEARGLLHKVDAAQVPEHVWDKIFAILDHQSTARVVRATL